MVRCVFGRVSYDEIYCQTLGCHHGHKCFSSKPCRLFFRYRTVIIRTRGTTRTIKIGGVSVISYYMKVKRPP
jgi:hypothetical protein